MEGGISKPDKTKFTECWRTTWKTSYIMRLASSAGFGGLLFGYDTELVQDLNEVANLQERISCCWPGERLLRFVHAGDTAVAIAESTAFRSRDFLSRVAYRFLAGVASNNSLLNVEFPRATRIEEDLLDSKLVGSRTFFPLVLNHEVVQKWKIRMKRRLSSSSSDWMQKHC